MSLVPCCLVLLLASVTHASQPHIIFIMADDLGWNDVSFHGSDQIPTPNIDALAYNGVILNSHYVQPLCTPTRSALMTGRYPFHIGMQGDPMLAAEPRGLPMMKILPEYLKDLGYTTRAVGKWHLGFYKRKYTPTYRGFDSFLGYWAGSISYFDHVLQDIYPNGPTLNGYDFRRNMETAWDLDGQYATDVFTDEALRIIHSHNDSKPLFLYLSHLAVHSGNVGKLVEAPQETVDKFKYISEPNRRTYAAMVSKVDESVGRVVEGLKKKNMLDNSIIVFLSDNGAPSVGIFQNWGSNYPLRGLKGTLWDGGVRGVGLIWSPLIRSPRRVSNEMMHITDWLPTLYRAAGGDISYLNSDLDGFDQWSSLVNNEKSPREFFIVNINERDQTAALRIGQWKLVLGSSGVNGSLDYYFGDSGQAASNPKYDTLSVINSPTWKSVSRRTSITYNEVHNLRRAATLKCSSTDYNTNCNPSLTKSPCLFNIYIDPCEMTDVSHNHTDIATKMYNILVRQRQFLVPQLNTRWDFSGANPVKFNNTWSPWED